MKVTEEILFNRCALKAIKKGNAILMLLCFEIWEYSCKSADFIAAVYWKNEHANFINSGLDSLMSK